jgi:hypothetical protein
MKADEILFSVVVKHNVIKENKLILSDHKAKQHVSAKREQKKMENGEDNTKRT